MKLLGLKEKVLSVFLPYTAAKGVKNCKTLLSFLFSGHQRYLLLL